MMIFSVSLVAVTGLEKCCISALTVSLRRGSCGPCASCFILALLAVKEKTTKIKKKKKKKKRRKVPIKIKEYKRRITNWQKLYSQYT